MEHLPEDSPAEYESGHANGGPVAVTEADITGEDTGRKSEQRRRPSVITPPVDSLAIATYLADVLRDRGIFRDAS